MRGGYSKHFGLYSLQGLERVPRSAEAFERLARSNRVQAGHGFGHDIKPFSEIFLGFHRFLEGFG